jgi:hypothetical protein
MPNQLPPNNAEDGPPLWPRTVILGTLLGLFWFVGMPFAIAYGDDGHRPSLLGAFLLVWVGTIAIVVLVVALFVLDRRRLKRKKARR